MYNLSALLCGAFFGGARRDTHDYVDPCHRAMLIFLLACATFSPVAELPDLLTFINGTRVATPEAWTARRGELRALLQEHILGTLPESTPSLTDVVLLNQTAHEGMHDANVRLTFSTNSTANVSFVIRLAWRADVSSQPMPVFLTQYNHQGWALAGVQRGYVAVAYPGGDTRDASGAFRASYPYNSFRKILARAFVAMRVIDFLTSDDAYPRLVRADALPTIDVRRICISGHSRNGKQSLVAAAFDERIAAVVGSSPGTPISAPVRYSSPDFNGETVNYVTQARDWWLPSLRGYFGREHELPADGHMVLALIAPRRALIATALSDGEGDVSFAVERGVHAATAAYTLLGASEHLRARWRSARHHGALDVQSYFDWFDGSSATGAGFNEAPLHLFEWTQWNRSVPAPPPPPAVGAPLRDRMLWLLGGRHSLAAGAANALHGGSHYCETGDPGSSFDFASALMLRDSLPACRGTACTFAVTRHALSFGAYITADLFLPSARPAQGFRSAAPPLDTALPVVIFLHGHSYQLGYSGIYGLYKSTDHGGLLHALAARGVAVLAFDQVGMGSRQAIDGAPLFYRRHPGSSRLAAMVGEVHAALDFIRCVSPAAVAGECPDPEVHTNTYPALDLPLLDASRVYLLGYSLGALVALHAAALAPPGRAIAGVAAVGGWTPFRDGGGGAATGGLRLLYDTHALLPRLGLFESRAHDVPYDYDELLAALAPRPTMLYAPTADRFANATSVGHALEAARAAWAASGAPANLEVHTPNEPSDMRDAQIAATLSWVERVVLGQGMASP